MDLFTDPTIFDVARRTEQHGADYIADAQSVLREYLRRVDGDDLSRLQVAQTYAAERAAKLARALTLDRWLWFLRRLPPLVFDAAPQHLQVFDWYFVETAAALSAAPGVMAAGGGPIRTKIVDTVMKFVAFALWDSNLRARLRCARLGVPLDSELLPRIVQNDPLAAALTLVDERRHQEAIPFARWGTLAGALGSPAPEFAVNTYFRSTELRTTSTERIGRALDPCEIRGWFYVHRLDLAAVRRALEDEALESFAGARQVINIIMLLRATAVLTLMGRGPAEELITSGLCYVDREMFRFACHDAIPKTRSWLTTAFERFGAPDSADELEQQLTSHPITLEPLRSGPLVYAVTGGLALNAASASQELSAALEFPDVAGAAANRRAEVFELEVQQLIDSSPMAPKPRIRELARRTLRLQGQAITDVDAIADDGEFLMLISCKSVPMRAEYDAGDPRRTKNVSSLIEQSVADWLQKVAKLRQHPRGDNYDLTGYQLIAVVCTPLIMQVPLGPTTEAVRGTLKRYCSATELRDWLFGRAAKGRPTLV